METPKDRMVQLVRWYLSAFHAGRNSEIAKKPYNPILGETFSCFWKLPGNENSGVSENSVVSLSWRFSFSFIFFTGVNFCVICILSFSFRELVSLSNISLLLDLYVFTRLVLYIIV